MSRSPLSYPLNRGLDGDAGGAADLQTDVMRFMAILSLCLVAIFALVQSIPAGPAAVPPERTSGAAAPPAAVAPAVTRDDDAGHSPPPPAPAPVSPAGTPEPAAAAERPMPSERATPADDATTPRSEPAPDDQGFTLRFDSDTALEALVAQGEIGLYALGESETRRLAIERGRLGFWQASRPTRFHEMDAATVPDRVVAALRGTGTRDAVRWGVTLPARLTRDLDGFLTRHTGGDLVIGADGRLRLE